MPAPRAILAVAFAALLMGGTPAHAAFPGESGRIAFERSGAIWTVRPDGSQLTQITTGTRDASPAWSPDGTKIAFQRPHPGCTSGVCTDVYVVTADGASTTLAIADAAQPAWSPTGTQLTFIARQPGFGDSIWKANADGTGRTEVYDWEDADIIGIGAPAWSPAPRDLIAFHEGTLTTVCDPDLEECANLYPESVYTTPASPPNTSTFSGVTSGAAPNWSPDAGKIAFHTPPQDPNFPTGDLGGRIGTVNLDGTGRQLVTAGAGFESRPGFDSRPAWSPDGTRIVFGRNGDGIHVINADGSGDTRLVAEGTDPDWQPKQRAYPRPLSTGPVQASLVTAFQQCASPNRVHGPPLEHPSCNPPAPASPNLVVSAGEARVRSAGFVRLKALVGSPGPPDDSDVRMRLSLTNVMNASDLSDYTGILRPEVVVRLTDRDGFQRQTTEDFPFGFVVPCAPTSSTTDGSVCELATTAEAVLPGSVTEGARAIWALDQVKVYDGGPSGDGTDATLFAVQGLFVP